MKILPILVGLLLVVSFVFADVTVKVISYEKEIQSSGRAVIKVVAEYELDGVKIESNYPDGNWRTRYGYHNFSKENISKDIQTHCETITKYYIKPNRDAQTQKANGIIDNFITQQNSLASDSPDKIINLEYNIKSLYLDDLDLTIDAKGVIDR